MQHRVFGKKLSRDANERKSLFKNLTSSLVINSYIKTTEAKAKAIRGLVDKLVTQAKINTPHNKTLLQAFFQNKKVVDKLFNEIGPSYKNHPGGFTRIIRLGTRLGDRAQMVRLEFVEAGSEKLDVGEMKIEDGTKKPETKVPKAPKLSKTKTK
jgi:large subunit ribosomal protein L17